MYILNEESVSTTGKRFRNVLDWYFEDLNSTDAKKVDRNNLNQQAVLFIKQLFFHFNTQVCYLQQCPITFWEKYFAADQFIGREEFDNSFYFQNFGVI